MRTGFTDELILSTRARHARLSRRVAGDDRRTHPTFAKIDVVADKVTRAGIDLNDLPVREMESGSVVTGAVL